MQHLCSLSDWRFTMDKNFSSKKYMKDYFERYCKIHTLLFMLLKDASNKNLRQQIQTEMTHIYSSFRDNQNSIQTHIQTNKKALTDIFFEEPIYIDCQIHIHPNETVIVHEHGHEDYHSLNNDERTVFITPESTLNFKDDLKPCSFRIEAYSYFTNDDSIKLIGHPSRLYFNSLEWIQHFAQKIESHLTQQFSKYSHISRPHIQSYYTKV